MFKNELLHFVHFRPADGFVLAGSYRLIRNSLMMANADQFSEVEITEYMGMKAVFELMNKSYRVNHKEIEKTASILNRTIDDFRGVQTSGEAAEVLDRVITVVRGAKRKADEIYSKEMDLVASCKRRIEHLKEASELEAEISVNPRIMVGGTMFSRERVECVISSVDPNGHKDQESANVSQETLAKKELITARCNRFLTEHLFAEGHYRAALSLAQQSPNPDEIFIKIFEEAVAIQEALSVGNTEPALKWFNEVKFRLKNSGCTFDFDLRIFELYLLVKANKRIEAVYHARKYLGDFQQEDDYKSRRLGQAMVLLIMRTPEEVEAKAEQNELNEPWILKRFHLALMNFYSFSQPTPFSMAVRAGIAAIKTNFCYNAKTHNRDCVVCHPLINRFAKDMPFGHHDQSILTCYKTGLIMNEENPPMALPNGYVYSRKGIEELTNSEGTVTCPRTGETFDASEVKRVFVL